MDMNYQNTGSKYFQLGSRTGDELKSAMTDSIKNSSSETIKATNKSTDYDLVIKQFDDLMCELSCSKYINKQCLNNEEHVDKNLKFNPKNKSNHSSLRDAKVSADENIPEVGRNLKYTVTEHVKDNANPRKDLLEMKPCTTTVDKSTTDNSNDCSSLEAQEKVLWINSNLWRLENEEKIPAMQQSKPVKHVLEYNLSEGKSKYSNAKEYQLKLSKFPNHGLNDFNYHSAQSLYRQSDGRNAHSLSNRDAVRYDRSTLPYPNACFMKKGMYNSTFESHSTKINGNRSLNKMYKPSGYLTSKSASDNCFLVKLFIETKALHLGPFSFEIYSKMTLRLLKLKVEQEHGISASSQRWILGECFAVENDKSLSDYNVTPGSPIIVYVDNKKNVPSTITSVANQLVSKEIEGNRFSDKSFMIKDKERRESFDDVTQSSTPRESRELIRKDSLDSKLVQLKSKFDIIRSRKLSNQSSDNSSIDMPIGEEDFDPMLNKHVKSGRVKSPAVRRKVLRKNSEPKKKTRIVIHQKQEMYDCAGSSTFNKCTKNDSVDEQLKVTPGKNKNSYYGESTFEKPTESQFRATDSNESSNNKSNDWQVTGVKQSDMQYNVSDISENSKASSSSNSLNFYDAEVIDDNTSESLNIGSKQSTDHEKDDIAVSKDSNIFSVSHSEKPPLLTMSTLEYYENMVKLKDDSQEIIDPEPKPKRSLTSLIKKLSLSQRTKSLDDSTSLDCSRTVETSAEPPTLDSNLPMPSDIHIDISPDDSTVQSENANTDHVDCNIQEEMPDPDPELLKNFELMMQIENLDLVENTTSFTCPVCFDEYESGQGVILHDCLHTFCRDCLSNSVSYADGVLVKCPYRDDFYSCLSHLQQREVKALVSEDVYEKYLQRSIITAEGLAESSFHCKTPDCPGWCVFDNAINVFQCPVCFHYNCLNCRAIHEGLNCRQYQDKLKLQQKVDKDSEKTLELLNSMIKSGKALKCPKCDLILLKKWGCDWLKCSVCKTEICWITKGPRWGPGGQGDISGGCKCGVNGIKCHPSCTYCH